MKPIALLGPNQGAVALVGMFLYYLDFVDSGFRIHRPESYMKRPEEGENLWRECYRVNEPASEALAQVRPGEFVITHLPCAEPTQSLMVDKTIIVGGRNLLDITASAAESWHDIRWYRGEERAEHYVHAHSDPRERLVAFLQSEQIVEHWIQPQLAMAYWATLNHPDKFVIRLEDLLQPTATGSAHLSERLRELCEFVGRSYEEPELQQRFAYYTALTHELPGPRQGVRRIDVMYPDRSVWTPQSLALFRSMGGEAANAAMGY